MQIKPRTISSRLYLVWNVKLLLSWRNLHNLIDLVLEWEYEIVFVDEIWGCLLGCLCGSLPVGGYCPSFAKFSLVRISHSLAYIGFLSVPYFTSQLLTYSDHGNEKYTSDAEELRIAIRYITFNVPGLPSNRHNKLLKTLPYRSFPDTSVTTRISFIAPQTSIATPGNRFGFCAISMFASASPEVNNIPTEFWKVTYDNEQLA